MKSKITLIIRVALSIVLVILIYRETGIFTSIFAATMVIYTELGSIQNKLQSDLNNDMIDSIININKKK